MKYLPVIAFSLATAACVGLASGDLRVGMSTAEDVVRTLGEPVMQWSDPDGGRRYAYPAGPAGVSTTMVDIGADGRVTRIDNVLAPESVARLAAGMDKQQVLRALGPPEPSWTAYFQARDELVWEWRVCDEWRQLARFDVLFDATQGIVRSTMTQREYCGRHSCWC